MILRLLGCPIKTWQEKVELLDSHLSAQVFSCLIFVKVFILLLSAIVNVCKCLWFTPVFCKISTNWLYIYFFLFVEKFYLAQIVSIFFIGLVIRFCFASKADILIFLSETSE